MISVVVIMQMAMLVLVTRTFSPSGDEKDGDDADDGSDDSDGCRGSYREFA